ncbi:glycerophosphodiester phosphodiesterase [Aporhodopirellula rubra]|uniref:glycerophosphodiester phosphodiesterase n=1 Tax=Aporhodopirellula rubra TaxID=980271 RepID=UPI0016143EC8|nr:glycerophosphodiester phosphodiesterase [Aporhodopirellula rubra]
MADVKEPIVIAHRGASGYVPEHTLIAKGIAHAMGADFIEQDVVLSKDGVPVVLHDVQLDTVTNVAKVFSHRRRSDGRYYVIDFTVQELKSLNVYERFDRVTGRPIFPNRYPGGEGDFRISTLAEEIRFIQNLNRTTGRDVGIYPEIKRPAWHREQGMELTPVVLGVLAEFGYAKRHDKCYIQCFDFPEISSIRNRYGYKGRLIQLIDQGHDKESETNYDWLKSQEGLGEIAKMVEGIGPSLDDVLQASGDSREPKIAASGLTEAAHSFELLVHPWTFRADALPSCVSSSDAFLDACFQIAKVDGLFADQPDTVVRYLRSQTEKDS